jgi:hypothetical protein
MPKQKYVDILGPEEGIFLAGDFDFGPKLQFLVKLRGHHAPYHQSNLPKKYPFFFVLR